MTTNLSHWSSIARQRMSRRRVLAGALAGGLGAVAWASCGGEEPSGVTEPQRGGTLRTGTLSPYSGLDPQTEIGTGLEITARIYGYPIHVDSRDDSILYDQAESVEQPDPLTYLFALRPDVRFQHVEPVQGRALVGEDMTLSIARFRDNPIAPTRTFHTSILDRAEVVDDETVRVTIRRPYAYTLSHVGDISAGAILPREVIEARTSLYTTGAGTGPFRVDTVSPPDRARLLRHDGYFRAPVPYLDAMEWRVYPDAEALQAAMRARNVDIIAASAQDLVQPLAAESTDILTNSEPNLSWLAIGLRVDRGPFQDLRVREAIDLALDRDAMIRAVAPDTGRVTGPINPHLADGFWALPDEEVREASGGVATIDERRAQARQLLAAAAMTEAAFTMQVADVPAPVEIADLIHQQLLEVGATVTIEAQPLLSWFTNLRRGAFEATLISHLPYESPDIPARFFHSLGPDATSSPFGFHDAAIDALIERSWGEEDRGTRQQTLLVAQRLMLNARPLIGLFTNVGYSAAWRQVQNLRPGLPGSLAHYNYEQWLLEDAD